jgi:hypothetical protein
LIDFHEKQGWGRGVGATNPVVRGSLFQPPLKTIDMQGLGWVDGWSDEPCGHRLALPTTPKINNKKKDPYLASCSGGMKLGCMRLSAAPVEQKYFMVIVVQVENSRINSPFVFSLVISFDFNVKNNGKEKCENTKKIYWF